MKIRDLEKQDFLHIKKLGYLDILDFGYKSSYIVPVVYLILTIHSIINEGLHYFYLAVPIFLIILVYVIYYVVLCLIKPPKEIIEGPKTEKKKGELLIEIMFKSRIVYFIICLGLILYILFSGFFFISLGFGVRYLLIQSFFFWGFLNYLFISFWRIKKYIWIYSNGIGIEDGSWENFFFDSEIEKIELLKKKNGYSFNLEIEGGEKHTRYNIGFEVEKLKKILKINFTNKFFC